MLFHEDPFDTQGLFEKNEGFTKKFRNLKITKQGYVFKSDHLGSEIFDGFTGPFHYENYNRRNSGVIGGTTLTTGTQVEEINYSRAE